jgi:hypothetical protein
MESQDHDLRLRLALLYLGLGTAEWVALVAISARNNPNYPGVSYFILVMWASAIALGVVDARTSHMRAALLLVLPALLLGWWTTPRGDNDGLWLLTLPIVASAAIPAWMCHWLGSRAKRLLKS